MARSKTPKTRKPRKLKVGARVGLQLGAASAVPAVVIEDVGPIGFGGRQWVRIRLTDDNDREFDFPAELLVAAPS